MAETAEFRACMALADIARDTALSYFRTPLKVEHKSEEQPVTIADRLIEEQMRALIEAQFPQDGIFGEEYGIKPSANGRHWVLDPIDGTKAFITGMPTFCSLICLLTEDQGPLVSCIEVPGLRERFAAQRGLGATWQQGSKQAACTVAGVKPLSNRIATSTTIDMFAGSDLTAYNRLTASLAGRRFGGDAYSFGLLSAGFFDYVIEADLQPYDFLAPSLIVSEAGGLMTDWQGKPLNLSSDGRVLASNSKVAHDEALALLTNS